MKINKISSIFLPTKDFGFVKQKLKEFELSKSVQSILFLMAGEDRLSDSRVETLFKDINTPVLGGIFPELVVAEKRKKSGILMIPLDYRLVTQLFDLSQNVECFEHQLMEVYNDNIQAESSLIVFADAQGVNKKPFMESLFNFFGISVSYIGAGAGTLCFEQIPCVIDNKGLHKNAAVIGWGKKKISIGVAHGWLAISEPLKLTEVRNGKELVSINWKPAFEVYKEIVEAHAGQNITEENFFDIAKAYPLGIARIDAEMVVRDPFMAKGDVIHVFDAIEDGEYVKVLYGDIKTLLEGASQARDKAFLNAQTNAPTDLVLCIDCISRVLFMQDAFEKELDIVGKDVQVNGVLSIGEIANSEDSYLEVFNKTVVVGLW